MEIEEYRAQFIDQLRFDADHEGTEPETQFILKTLEELESIGEFNDPMPMSIEMRGKRGRIMAFDAYAYDLHYEVHVKGKVVNPVNYYFLDLSAEDYDRMIQIAANNGKVLD